MVVDVVERLPHRLEPSFPQGDTPSEKRALQHEGLKRHQLLAKTYISMAPWPCVVMATLHDPHFLDDLAFGARKEK